MCKPLSFATLSSSPFRGAEAAAPQREAKSLPYNGRCRAESVYHLTQYTPSASLCSAAPPEVEPRVLRTKERREAKSLPYETQKILAYTKQYVTLLRELRVAKLAVRMKHSL